jgi:hypothetical protein
VAAGSAEGGDSRGGDRLDIANEFATVFFAHNANARERCLGSGPIARVPAPLNFRSSPAVDTARRPERDQRPKHFLVGMFYDIITTMSLVCPRSTAVGIRPGVPVAIVEGSNRLLGSRMGFRFSVGPDLAQPLSNESVPSTSGDNP